MRMSTTKNGTLIIRMPLRLKEKIEDLAKEKNVSASFFQVFYLESTDRSIKHI